MTRPVSAASSAVFRIGFGLVGFILIVRFFAHGWIDTLFVDPPFHFTYPGFAWVDSLPGPWTHVVFALLGVAAVAVAFGYRHRLASGVFASGLAYVELIDRTNYLNHYYWMILTAALLVFLPVNRMWSLDARLGRVSQSGWVPVWVVWLLRFQVGMVYFFAGLAKLNSDWLFRAEPLATWLPARSEMFLVGPLLALPATAFVLSWAGAFFDLTVVGWLLMPRARLIAFMALVSFHTTTWLLFPSIGVFPLIMSLSALVFFPPDWPVSLLRSRHAHVGHSVRLRPVWVGLAALYVLAMVVIPLRHLAIPGDVRWTGEGYLGSWQVMLTDKTGTVEFVVTEDGRSWIVPPPAGLTDRQLAVMATDPALIRQTARIIAADYDGTVGARAIVAVNGRTAVDFTDPTIDLTHGPVSASEWVIAAP
jgi:vitamin K-dependent gamma-carboxylase